VFFGALHKEGGDATKPQLAHLLGPAGRPEPGGGLVRPLPV
jgi:hypothetical protein